MNQLAVQKNFSLTPKTLDEAMQYSKLIADSDFCPKEYKGKTGNVLVAIQYGSELGLSPMQALQNISIINGKPCLWGDAMLALVKANKTFVNMHEEVKSGVACCVVERKNQEPVERTFSIDDAKKAGLWGKQGPWTQYPNRMLQMRARSFALRDSFPDVLKGLIAREEAEDYYIRSKPVIRSITSTQIENNKLELLKQDEQLDLNADIYRIQSCETIDDLKIAFNDITKIWRDKKNLDAIKKIIDEKDKKVSELNNKEFVKEMDEEEVNQND